MKSILKTEQPLIAIVLLPFLYLTLIWNSLPAKVPLHWNLQGEIDRWGSKYELLLIPILLPLLTYVIFLIVPKIDPKNKLAQMGNKYQTLKFILTAFMSILALFIIHASKTQSIADPNLIILGVGLLFMVLGNFFKTIRSNYFIGIRTPWTLENERVWKETHILGGKLWFIGGLIIILSSLVLSAELNFIVLMIITGIIVLVPIVFSYLKYRELDQMV